MKELDQRKLKVLADLNRPAGKLRSRLVVLWIDGDQERAKRWAEEHKFPVGVISSRSEDLSAWNIDPAVIDTTVLVVENHVAGTATDLTDSGAGGLVTRVAKLAVARAASDNRPIKKWASLVVRRDARTLAELIAAVPPPPSRQLEVLQPLKREGGISTDETNNTTEVRKTPATAGLQLLVAGRESDNIVRFDLSTGQATVVAKLAAGSGPWSIAVSPAGEIFVGLRGNKRNIVRLVPGPTRDPNGPLVAVDLTSNIGRFGPGLMAFDRRGILNVAGGTNRAVLRYDVKTGKLVEAARLRAANLVGLMLTGDSVYAAEFFQKTILRFDLTKDPISGEKFIYKSDHLDRAHGMTIGHNGNLFVSNLQNSRVQEFSGETGEFIKTFLDAHTIGGGSVKDLHFEPRLDHYLLTSGNAVYQVSTDGALLAKHESDALSGAVGIAVTAPRPPPPVSASTAKLPASAGLLGFATVGGKHIPVALRYQHGKTLQAARLVGSVTEAGKTPRDVKLVFRGHLNVTEPMTVKVFVGGGSSNGGNCWLRVANLEVGPLGDDHEKHVTKEIRLESGNYAIEWTLSGGDFGCGLLKFINAKTSQLLPIQHARTDHLDLPIEREIQVSSDKPGWPIPADWIDRTTKAWNTVVQPEARQSTRNLRIRVYQGDPAARAAGTNKLAIDRHITIGQPFEFKGEHSLVASGIVRRDESGKFQFQGSVRHNAGAMEFDSAAKLGAGMRAYGGGSSGGILPYFVQLDRPVFP